MDRISGENKVVFAYSKLAHEPSRLVEPWEVYLRITADFQVQVSSRTVYSEQLFPIVEFAILSQVWRLKDSEAGRDFVYTSMEAEEEGLVWIRRQEGGWLIGSVFQERESYELVSLSEIQRSLDALYARLRSEVKARFEVDIEALFAWKGAPLPGRNSAL